MLQEWLLRDLTATYHAYLHRLYSLAFAGTSQPLSELFSPPVFLPFPEWRFEQLSSCSSETDQPSQNNLFSENEAQFPFLIHELLHASNHILILGEAGAGKTTLLHYLAQSFSSPTVEMTDLNHELDEQRIPVMLYLSAYSDWLIPGNSPLLDAASHSISAKLKLPHRDAAELLESWQQDERLLLLVDGLNELPQKHLEIALQTIQQYACSAGGQKSRMIISSRPAGFINPSQSIQIFTMLPFAEISKNSAYVTNYLAATPNQRLKSKSDDIQADKIIEQIKNIPALRQIEQNPFLLRMVAEIFEGHNKRLPTDRSHLIESWMRHIYFLKRSTQYDTPNFEHTLEQLEEQAITWQQENIDSGRDEYIFSEHHPSGNKSILFHFFLQYPLIRDYLIARRLARDWHRDRHNTWLYLKPRLHLPQWREVLLLMSSMLRKNEQRNMTSLILRAGSKNESTLYRDLQLTLSLLREGSQISPENENKIKQHIHHDLLAKNISDDQKEHLLHQLSIPVYPVADALLQILESEIMQQGSRKDRNPILRLTCQTLGNLETIEAVRPLVRLLDHSNWEIRLAASSALGYIQQNSAVQPLIVMLQDKQTRVRYAAATALGMLSGTIALEQLIEQLLTKNLNEDERLWLAIAIQHCQNNASLQLLIQNLKEENWLLRFVAAGALGNYQDPAVLNPLIQALRDEDADVRRSAGAALARMRDPAIVRKIIDSLFHEDLEIRRSAAVFLGEIDTPAAIEIQIALLQDENWYVRCMAAESLGKMQAIKAVPHLIRLLQDEDIRRPVAEALGNIEEAVAVGPLMMLLNDKKESVRLSVAIALSKIQDPYAGKNLVALIKNENLNSQPSLDRILQKTGEQDIAAALIKLLQHENWFIRASAALALSHRPEQPPLASLLHLLHDKHWYVRFSLASTLGQIDDANAVIALIRLMKDDNLFVRLSAEQALNQIHNETVIPFLIDALKDGEEQSSRLAACALENLHSPLAIQPLYSLLREPGQPADVRRPAIRALGKISNTAVIPLLFSLLKDEDVDVRRTAARALATSSNFLDLRKSLEKHPEVFKHLDAAEMALLCNVGIFLPLQLHFENPIA